MKINTEFRYGSVWMLVIFVPKLISVFRDNPSIRDNVHVRTETYEIILCIIRRHEGKILLGLLPYTRVAHTHVLFYSPLTEQLIQKGARVLSQKLFGEHMNELRLDSFRGSKRIRIIFIYMRVHSLWQRHGKVRLQFTRREKALYERYAYYGKE